MCSKLDKKEMITSSNEGFSGACISSRALILSPNGFHPCMYRICVVLFYVATLCAFVCTFMASLSCWASYWAGVFNSASTTSSRSPFRAFFSAASRGYNELKHNLRKRCPRVCPRSFISPSRWTVDRPLLSADAARCSFSPECQL